MKISVFNTGSIGINPRKYYDNCVFERYPDLGGLKNIPNLVFLVESGCSKYMIDCGFSSNNPMGFGILGWFLKKTYRVGVAEKVRGVSDQINGDIDGVDVCVTHLHADHISGMSELVNRVGDFYVDQEDFEDVSICGRLNYPRRVFKKFESHFRYGAPEGVKVIPLPGHTPHHRGFMFEDDSCKVAFVGDAIESPYSLLDIDSPGRFYQNPVERKGSVEKLVGLAEEGCLLLGAHDSSLVGINGEMGEDRIKGAFEFQKNILDQVD